MPEQIVQSPDWKLWIILYLFFGGIAAGAYFTASLLDLFAPRWEAESSPDAVIRASNLVGRRMKASSEHEVARFGYLIAFPLAVLCGIFLAVDLGRPERFWHMLWDTYSNHPSIRWGSPMSVGSWGLTIFGAFAFVSFIGALVELGWLRVALLRRLDALIRRTALHVPFALAGSAFGFFLGSYTGVLLSVSNQPIWSDTHVLGALFLASAASTGMATLALALVLRRRTGEETLHRLERADSFAMVVELALLVIFLVTVGTVAKPLYSRKYAPWLWAGVVALGLLVPLALRLRPRLLGSFSPALGAVLVLAGGLVLRAVIVLAPQA